MLCPVIVLDREPPAAVNQNKDCHDDCGKAGDQTEVLKQHDVADTACHAETGLLTERETLSVILDRCVSWVNLTAFCLKKYGAQAIRVWE